MKNYMMYAISAVHFRLLWIFESMKAFRQVNVAVAGNGNHSSYISKKKKKNLPRELLPLISLGSWGLRKSLCQLLV